MIFMSLIKVKEFTMSELLSHSEISTSNLSLLFNSVSYNFFTVFSYLLTAKFISSLFPSYLRRTKKITSTVRENILDMSLLVVVLVINF